MVEYPTATVKYKTGIKEMIFYIDLFRNVMLDTVVSDVHLHPYPFLPNNIYSYDNNLATNIPPWQIST